MKFTYFSRKLDEMENISARLEITHHLSELYSKLSDNEITSASYLMLGSLVPPYESLEFQLSVKMVIRALARLNPSDSTSSKPNKISQEALFDQGIQDSQDAINNLTKIYKSKGDVGLVAKEVVGGSAKNGLSVADVYQMLVDIAKESGQGSQERKVAGLVSLFEQLDPVSAKFVARIVIGKLRLGFSTMTMIDALSWARHGDKTDRVILENAYQKQADIGSLARTYLSAENDSRARKQLEDYSVVVGVPVVPALCQRLNTAAEIIEKMQEVIVEPKYDGLRVQVHLETGQPPKAFTRNLENVSHMFPELAEVQEQLNCSSCIIDTEAIGYDPETDELKPFQETITRKRKHAISDQAGKVPIRFYAFDVLAVDGKTYLETPLQERKKLLRSLFEDSAVLQYAEDFTTQDPLELNEAHERYLSEGLEGAVIKQIDSPYISGRKGWRWVKIKESEGTSGKLSDTLDLVVMGYYYGRGKRTEFGVGAFLVGVLDEKEQEIKTIAKIGTGLSDDQFRELKKRGDDLAEVKKPGSYQVHKDLKPDVWTRPELVVEIAADEITKSPNHTAKVALRFPRLLKFRDDKKWDQATTIKEVKKIREMSSV